MSSGDHGGISAIIQMIKKTKIPIICICNDRQSPKIRSLATYCYDIKFHKTNRNIIVKTL
jgi:replication factor C subunit 1